MRRVKHASKPGGVAFAREQRRRPTRGETILWKWLRSGIGGAKFRRQHPVLDFVLDFYCEEAQLAVEIDGPDHVARANYDAWRDERLGDLGIRVLRVKSEEVEEDPMRIVERIRDFLTPGPSPALRLGEGCTAGPEHRD